MRFRSSSRPVDERMKDYLGGLQIVSLGNPFQSKGYAGWFIPYEIKLTMKIQFAVRNDNPAKRYVVFGPGMEGRPAGAIRRFRISAAASACRSAWKTWT